MPTAIVSVPERKRETREIENVCVSVCVSAQSAVRYAKLTSLLRQFVARQSCWNRQSFNMNLLVRLKDAAK